MICHSIESETMSFRRRHRLRTIGGRMKTRFHVGWRQIRYWMEYVYQLPSVSSESLRRIRVSRLTERVRQALSSPDSETRTWCRCRKLYGLPILGRRPATQHGPLRLFFCDPGTVPPRNVTVYEGLVITMRAKASFIATGREHKTTQVKCRRLLRVAI